MFSAFFICILFLFLLLLSSCFIHSCQRGCFGFCIPQSPTVFAALTPQNKFLLNLTPSLFSIQNPVIPLYNRWISTLWVSIRGARPFHSLPPSTTIFIPAFDAGLIEIELIHPKTPWPNAQQPTSLNTHIPILILCPSIGAVLRDPCVADTFRSAYEDGWICICLIHRGSGSLQLNKKTLTSWGETRFLQDLMLYVKKTYTHHPVIAAGFSMGSNWLTKYMGTINEDPHHSLYHAIAGALTFSNCWCPDAPNYNAYDHIRNSSLAHTAVWKHSSNPIKKATTNIKTSDIFIQMLNSNNIEDFDTLYHLNILHHHNWPSALHSISGLSTIHNITKPFFALGSCDDPFIKLSSPLLDNYRSLPLKYPTIICATSPFGGHIAW